MPGAADSRRSEGGSRGSVGVAGQDICVVASTTRRSVACQQQLFFRYVLFSILLTSLPVSFERNVALQFALSSGYSYLVQIQPLLSTRSEPQRSTGALELPGLSLTLTAVCDRRKQLRAGQCHAARQTIERELFL